MGLQRCVERILPSVDTARAQLSRFDPKEIIALFTWIGVISDLYISGCSPPGCGAAAAIVGLGLA